MADEPRIRRARVEDAARIVELVRAGFAPDLIDLFIYGCAGIERYVALQIESEMAGGDTSYFVAERDGDILGSAELRRVGDALWLNYIAVDPTQRARGVARQLLATAVGELAPASAGTFTLDVLENNHVARRWYDALELAVDAASAWLSIPLPATTGAPRARISGLPQARVCHERFGFSQISVACAGATHAIGMLGTRWFRVTTAAALGDPELAAALHRLDPGRAILAVVPDRGDVPAGATLRARTQRRTCSVAHLAARLGATS